MLIDVQINAVYQKSQKNRKIIANDFEIKFDEKSENEIRNEIQDRSKRSTQINKLMYSLIKKDVIPICPEMTEDEIG
ncbi:hypothetical protein [Cupriavidus basilensis]|uniref:hypothetical protein n=1 Tax=Cupriavidus basilensis TaxID=68895 RepID=UPI0023E766F1|nr:hypothetical protein [Cupriavidus basilensis]MDF3881013.1 hypothetical protein [Cupriavidus basilensis]